MRIQSFPPHQMPFLSNFNKTLHSATNYVTHKLHVYLARANSHLHHVFLPHVNHKLPKA